MKASEIKVGTRCFAYVGEARVEVEVVRDTLARVRRYWVKRCDNGKFLPSLRAASALHASPEGEWGGCFGEPLKAHHCDRECNRLLNEIDAWQRGAMGTIGRPSTGERYALDMREHVKACDEALRGRGHFVPTPPRPMPSPTEVRALRERLDEAESAVRDCDDRERFAHPVVEAARQDGVEDAEREAGL